MINDQADTHSGIATILATHVKLANFSLILMIMKDMTQESQFRIILPMESISKK